jgi:hypothetical protein
MMDAGKREGKDLGHVGIGDGLLNGGFACSSAIFRNSRNVNFVLATALPVLAALGEDAGEQGRAGFVASVREARRACGY